MHHRRTCGSAAVLTSGQLERSAEGAITVSYQEMFTIGKQISNSESSFMPFLVAGVFYFVFNAVVDFVMGRIEKRMSYYK